MRAIKSSAALIKIAYDVFPIWIPLLSWTGDQGDEQWQHRPGKELILQGGLGLQNGGGVYFSA